MSRFFCSTYGSKFFVWLVRIFWQKNGTWRRDTKYLQDTWKIFLFVGLILYCWTWIFVHFFIIHTLLSTDWPNRHPRSKYLQRCWNPSAWQVWGCWRKICWEWHYKVSNFSSEFVCTLLVCLRLHIDQWLSKFSRNLKFSKIMRYCFTTISCWSWSIL